MTDPTGGCTCPALWNGVVPPECRIHNPAGRTFTTTGTSASWMLDGTLTECPIAGVHEHAFRGPHRFREWDPVVPLHGDVERLLISMVRTSYRMDRNQYEKGWNEALHAARKKIAALATPAPEEADRE